MNERNDNFERYLREMMEMHSRAVPSEPPKKVEEIPEEPEITETEEEQEEESCEEQPEEEAEQPEELPETEDFFEKNDGQSEEKPSLCPICAGGIALCEFVVENARTGMPIENAQVLLYRSDGFFVRLLTDEGGSSGEIPIFAEGLWRVSITSHGYISVSKAPVEPIAGEKITVPVRLDESISLDGIFTEHSDSILGA